MQLVIGTYERFLLGYRLPEELQVRLQFVKVQQQQQAAAVRDNSLANPGVIHRLHTASTRRRDVSCNDLSPMRRIRYRQSTYGTTLAAGTAAADLLTAGLESAA